MILLMEVWETAVFASTWFLCHEFLSPWLPCHDFCWWNISLLCQMHPLPHLLRICASIFAALCVLGGFHFYLVPGRYRYGFNMIQLQHARGWCFSTQRVHGWFKRFSRKGRSYFSFTFAETSCLILNERWEYIWTYLMGGYLNHRNMTYWAEQKDSSIHVSHLRIHLLSGLWLFARRPRSWRTRPPSSSSSTSCGVGNVGGTASYLVGSCTRAGLMFVATNDTSIKKI